MPDLFCPECRTHLKEEEDRSTFARLKAHLNPQASLLAKPSSEKTKLSTARENEDRAEDEPRGKDSAAAAATGTS